MKEFKLHWYTEALLERTELKEVEEIKHECKKDCHSPEKNVQAFMDTIAYAEGTTLFGNQDGYNVIVGGSLFHDYKDHPRVLVNIPNLGIKSSAAGRYQILERYWDHYSKALKLKDFSTINQDLYAIQMFKEVKAYQDIRQGYFDSAVRKCASRWASFPGAGYNQPEKSLDRLRDIYIENGGGVYE